MNASDLAQALRDLLTPEQLAAILGSTRDSATVSDVVTAYLRDGDDDVTERVQEERQTSLTRFMADLGERRVCDCTPQVMRQWLNSHAGWRSKDTIATQLTNIKRAFNWAVENQLIHDFPFRCVRIRRGKRKRRGMSDEHYRDCLRHGHPGFRRLLVFLRLTGSRPGEAASLRWSHIDWERKVAVLREHKTAKQTGDVREIMLTPPVVKLLRWLKRQPARLPTAAWLVELLRNGPRRLVDVARQAKAAGITYRRLWRAKQAVGVRQRRVGAWGNMRGTQGYLVYELASDPPPPAADPDPYIFTNRQGGPWNRASWCQAIGRARKASATPIASIYCLRHRVATELCRAGVNLKVVAAILGHRSISTTSGYAEGIGDDVALLQSVLDRLPK
ncbi:MAG: tyrosine-type recombinase/integrase [Gemmataceae bacterium]|nr:tyrosine-type recombinase/integrase [Gemmataceae bacterium]